MIEDKLRSSVNWQWALTEKAWNKWGRRNTYGCSPPVVKSIFTWMVIMIKP